uniref:Small integral membrane protein 4 n=1 Tax=Sus scrofa TaxID=9823 RepID=A0A8D1KVF5_PIG
GKTTGPRLPAAARRTPSSCRPGVVRNLAPARFKSSGRPRRPPGPPAAVPPEELPGLEAPWPWRALPGRFTRGAAPRRSICLSVLPARDVPSLGLHPRSSSRFGSLTVHQSSHVLVSSPQRYSPGARTAPVVLCSASPPQPRSSMFSRAQVRRVLQRVPGKQRLGVYRFLPFFFVLGGTMEWIMIKVRVGQETFYDVYRRKASERQYQRRLEDASETELQQSIK